MVTTPTKQLKMTPGLLQCSEFLTSVLPLEDKLNESEDCLSVLVSVLSPAPYIVFSIEQTFHGYMLNDERKEGKLLRR